MARIGLAFGMKVILNNRSDKSTSLEVSRVDLDTLLDTSDFISINCPEIEPKFKPELLSLIELETELHPKAEINAREKNLVEKLRQQIKRSRLCCI